MNKIINLRFFCFLIIVFFFVSFARAQDSFDISDVLSISKRDMVLGDRKAQNTVIEYLSPSCYHCADFHIKTLPEIKKIYIDSGKIKWVTRIFVNDAPSLNIAKLTMCKADSQAFYKLLDLYLSNQSSWASSINSNATIKNIFLLAGNTKEYFDECVNSKNLENKIIDTRKNASNILKMLGTPTFYVNGKEEKIISASQLGSIINKSLG